jgi:hypothetical protein
MIDKDWTLALKNAFKELTDADRRVIELIWKYPGVPVFHLPEKLGQRPGGMVWLTIGNRIAKKLLWNRVPKRIRSQNEQLGYPPFYSGVLVYLTTVVDHNGRRFICFDLHDEAVKALQDLSFISRRQGPRSTSYTPVEALGQDVISISKSMPAETKRTLRSIVARRGQIEFRRKLLQAYGGRCAVTGCDEIQVLEAAHIRNFARQGRYDVRNGILLRADWHTLFDLGMWAIHPKSHRIIVSTVLSDTNYTKFGGRQISAPQDPKCAPNELELRNRYRLFKNGQQTTSV